VEADGQENCWLCGNVWAASLWCPRSSIGRQKGKRYWRYAQGVSLGCRPGKVIITRRVQGTGGAGRLLRLAPPRVRCQARRRTATGATDVQALQCNFHVSDWEADASEMSWRLC
jgi:hypothetical protein